jgi:trehalose 6-phosphate synthase
LVNPYDADELAEAMFQALTMSPEEQTRRMERMRRHVIDQNIYRWAGTLLSKAVALLDAK